MKLKKIVSLLLGLSMLFCICGCDPKPHGGGNPPEQKDNGIEALADTKFEYGLKLHGPDSRYHATMEWALFQDDDVIEDPIWRLGTWGCFVNYWLDSDMEFIEGSERYEYPARPVQVTEHDGWRSTENGTSKVEIHSGGAIRLAQNSGNEYGVTPAYTDAPRASLPRKDGEAWPHMIVEQYIPSNTRLSELEKVNFSIKFTVEKCDKAQGVTQNDSLHAAQFQWIISVRCDDPAKASYGKSFWFGIPLYDSRMTESNKDSIHADGGKEDATDSLIYGVASTYMLGEVGQVGKEYDVTVDMLPKLKAAFEAAQKKGMFTDCTLADMRIENTNIGWELPGVFDVSAKIDRLSMKYYKED